MSIKRKTPDSITIKGFVVVTPDPMSNLIDEIFEQIYEELKGFYALKELKDSLGKSN